MKIGTFCSGIGAPEQALKSLKINHSVEFAAEIDKYARITYLKNHEAKNFYEDLTKINYKSLPDVNLFVAGFPCQAFSIADDIRGTIFFNIHEYLKVKGPECFILENVKGLLSHDNGNTFGTIIKYLAKSINGNLSMFTDKNSVNYHIYYKALNATDYGIPQNRQRIFIIGFKNDNHSFTWPEPELLKLKLHDLLEKEVPEKYFLSNKAVQGLLNQEEKGFGFGANILISPKIRSRYYKDGSDCLIQSNQNQVRRLTPRECFRLMGFPDTFNISEVSETQAYKQAGNSIVVNVIEKIIKQII
jgi:DNA (cytosine-5)-methyltransferase 1